MKLSAEALVASIEGRLSLTNKLTGFAARTHGTDGIAVQR